jgi:hypothetical protein
MPKQTLLSRPAENNGLTQLYIRRTRNVKVDIKKFFQDLDWINLAQDRAQHQASVYLIIRNPITGLDRTRGFQEVEAPRFHDIRQMKVTWLSALRTSRLYPQ